MKNYSFSPVIDSSEKEEMFLNFLHLLDLAISCIGQEYIPKTGWNWKIGGGTALMLFIWHRKSKNLDIFLDNLQILTYLSPRLNSVSEDIAQDGYIEQSNFIKIKLSSGKEIDFIVSPTLLSLSPYSLNSFILSFIKTTIFLTSFPIFSLLLMHLRILFILYLLNPRRRLS